MKKSILFLLFTSCFFNLFSQEQTTKETLTSTVKEKTEELITSKKEVVETKAKEVVAKKMDIATSNESETTTFYLITNGKTKAPSDKYPDPYLNENGEKKAEQWIKILANVKLDAVYVQDITSAKQTAQKIATSQQLGIYALDIKNVYDNSFKYNTNGKNILIIANNTTLAYVANTVLGNEKYTTPKTTQYSDFYIVTVTKEYKNAIKLTIE